MITTTRREAMKARFQNRPLSDLVESFQFARTAIEDGAKDESVSLMAEVLKDLIESKSTGVRVESLNPVAQGQTDEVDHIGRRAGSAAGNQYGVFQVHAASEKQVNFLRRLLAEKDLTGVTVPATLDGISKTSASSLIEKLIDRPAKAGAATTADGPSEKQLVWLHRLVDEKDLTGTSLELMDHDNIPMLDRKAASKALDILFNLKDKPKANDLEVGIYLLDGAIVKAYMNQAKTRLLSAKLDMERAQAGETTDLWIYMGEASRFLKPEMKMGKEAQATWGVQFGICCRCGRLLSDPNSIDRGMGEWCYSQA